MANVTETSVWNPRTGGMETVAGADDPTTFKPLSAVDVDPEATIWDPTTGTKFRFMGFDLAGSIAGEYIFRDNTAGTVIYRTYLRANSPKTVALGAGVLSTAADNVLTLQGPTGAAVTGTIIGREE